MPIQFSPSDYQALVTLISQEPRFRTARERYALASEALAGNERADELLATIDWEGSSRTVAVDLIERLRYTGWLTKDTHALGVLVNDILTYRGDADPQAPFLRAWIDRNHLAPAPAAAPGVDAWQGQEDGALVKELVVGENTLRDIRYLALASQAANGVLRIVAPSGAGSGFMVADNLVMTNNHVLPDISSARLSSYHFNYQLDDHGQIQEGQIVTGEPQGLFYTNATLDVSVAQIQAPPANAKASTLSLFPIMLQREQRVAIIQHPGGGLKKISLQSNHVQFASSDVVQYTTTTQPGSSGSPVFNDDFNVVAVHHGARSVGGYIRNEGTTMRAILADLKQNQPELFKQLSVVLK